MADEIKKIITIEAGNSGRTLRELQQNFDNARIKLMSLDGATEEYQQQLVKVKAAQADYNKELRMAVKENKVADGSYQSLLNQLNRLKEQWKATGNAAERARLGAKINEVKGQLDTMDHSIGNWQRNVGNYGNAITQAFGKIRGAMSTLAIGLAALGTAFKVFNSIMQSTQSTGDALKTSIAGVKGTFDALMSSVASGDWSAFSGGFWDVYEAAKAAAAAIDQLQNTQLAFDYVTATNQTEFNKYYNIWRDKDSTDAMKADAEAQMKAIIDAQYKYAANYNKIALDGYRKLVQKEAGASNLSLNNITEAQFRKAMEIDLSADPEKERAKNESEYREYQRRLKEFGDNNLSAQAALKKEYADVIAIHAMLQLMQDDELQGLGQILTGMQRATQSAQQLERRLFRVEGSSNSPNNTPANKKDKPHAVNYNLAISEDEAYFDLEVEATADAEKQLEQIHNNAAAFRQKQQDEELGDLMEFGENYRKAQEARAEHEHDLLIRGIKERENIAAEEERIERERVQTIQKSATAIAGIMGSVASAYQAYISQRVEGGKISEEEAEKEFENVKAIQYAQTWINALAGAVSVWAGEGTNLTKAVQSAAVLAQGIAATAQIASTTLGSVSTATKAVTSAALAAPVVINTMPQVQTLTSASQEEALNARAEAQRVYVVYSDIAQAGRKVRVTEGESRF